MRYLFRRLSPDEPEALAASIAGLGLESDPGVPSHSPPVTDPIGRPYKTLQVDPEAEDEVIAAAYRRLARKYHPDTAAGDRTPPPGWRRSTRPGSSIGDPRTTSGDSTAIARRGRREALSGRRASDDRRPPAATRPPAPTAAVRRAQTARDRVARLDERALVGGRRLRPLDANGRWGGRGGPAAREPVRERHERSGATRAGRSGEIARADLEYIEWLDRMPIGRPYRDEIDAILRQSRAAASCDGGVERPARAVPPPLSGRMAAHAVGRIAAARDAPYASPLSAGLADVDALQDARGRSPCSRATRRRG